MDQPDYVEVPTPPPSPQYAYTPPPAAATGGLSDNAAGAICYITAIPAIIFLLIDPYNKKDFVRFNAFQSLLLTASWVVLHILVIIPILGWLVMLVGYLALFVGWILCIIKASQGTKFKLPFLGDLAENFAKSVGTP
jgi:uncharacterized membrane protein